MWPGEWFRDKDLPIETTPETPPNRPESSGSSDTQVTMHTDRETENSGGKPLVAPWMAEEAIKLGKLKFRAQNAMVNPLDDAQKALEAFTTECTERTTNDLKGCIDAFLQAFECYCVAHERLVEHVNKHSGLGYDPKQEEFEANESRFTDLASLMQKTLSDSLAEKMTEKLEAAALANREAKIQREAAVKAELNRMDKEELLQKLLDKQKLEEEEAATRVDTGANVALMADLMERPKSSVEEFHGRDDEDVVVWIEAFRACYLRPGYNPVTAYNTLRNKLKGKARKILGPIKQDAGAIEFVFQSLKDRYGDEEAKMRKAHREFDQLKRLNNFGNAEDAFDMHLAVSTMHYRMVQNGEKPDHRSILKWYDKFPIFVGTKWESRVRKGKNHKDDCQGFLDLVKELIQDRQVVTAGTEKPTPQKDKPETKGGGKSKNNANAFAGNATEEQKDAPKDKPKKAKKQKAEKSDEKSDGSGGAKQKNDQKLCAMGCTTAHNLENCQLYKDASVKKRWGQLKGAGGCYSCLRSGHLANDCTAGKTCNVNNCSKSHHPSLHQ